MTTERQQSHRQSGARAFTLLEILASLAIVAVLLAVLVAFVGNWVTQARLTADKQTLAVLNDAITRYKTEGGTINALTYGKPFTQLTTALACPVSWNGLTHQFWRGGNNAVAQARTIAAAGDGKTYHLTRYNTYIESGTENSSYTTTGGNWWVSTFAGGGTAADGTGAAASFSGLKHITTDSSGNIYASDYNNNAIRKITPAGVVTTFAGNGSYGYTDDVTTAASFRAPWGLASDNANNIYVGEHGGHRVRKITPAGSVTTLAGNGNPGYADGNGATAMFRTPDGIVVDDAGNVYVTELYGYRVRKITPSGTVSTIAGSGTSAYLDGVGTSASFIQPEGIVIDGGGNLFVADGGAHRIRKIATDGTVTTFAGSGTASSVDGTGTAASLAGPSELAIDPAGNIYVAERMGGKIRKITPAGVVTTLASGLSYPYGVAIDTSGNIYASADYQTDKIYTISGGVATVFAGSGLAYINGNGSAASLLSPQGAVLDNAGNLYVTSNNCIRKITPSADVTTLAGNGTTGYADDAGTAARFNGPRGIAIDSSNNLYVADCYNQRIRKISPAGVVTTLAGSGTQSWADGTGMAASFSNPTGIGVDRAGNVFVADSSNNRIRKITSSGIVTTLAGSGSSGVTDGTGAAATFSNPTDIAVDSAGNIFVADAYGHRIRKITQAGVVTTLTTSGFGNPWGLSIDNSDCLFVADYASHWVKKVTPQGVITTLAGTGSAGYLDGAGSLARFNSPCDVVVASPSLIYVIDSNNSRIRKIQRQ